MAFGSTLLIGLLVLLVGLLYAQIPLRIDPVAVEWTQNKSTDGPFAYNNDLGDVIQFAKGKIHGPETIVFSPKNELLAFTEYGQISQVHDDGTVTEWAYVGGRPISGVFDQNGDLIVCDVQKGLLKVNAVTKEVTILAARDDDDKLPINFIDDVDIAPDGKIYFSDATHIPPKKYPNGFMDLGVTSAEEGLEGRKTGRLLEYDPTTKKTRTLIKGLSFGNGVAVSKDGDYVLINDTFLKKIRRYWLKGPKKGTYEFFGSVFPAMLDGISKSSRGTYWVAGYTLDQEPGFPFIADKPWLKSFIARLFLEQILKFAKHVGVVFEVDAEGNVLRTLYDLKGEKVWSITSITEHGGKLYLGGFNDFIGIKTL